MLKGLPFKSGGICSGSMRQHACFCTALSDDQGRAVDMAFAMCVATVRFICAAMVLFDLQYRVKMALLQYHPHDFYRIAVMHSLRDGLDLMPVGLESRALKHAILNIRAHPLYLDGIQISSTSIKRGGTF